MLKQLKATFIVLVPKSENTVSPSKYMPISLTNELYKIIIRIIVNWLKPLMSKLVGLVQSTFIPRLSIADNILPI